MKKRLLVTGGTGFVAGGVIAQALADWEVHVLSRNEPPIKRRELAWHTLDVLDPDDLANVFRQVNPNAIIHAAALADIDYCQANKALADKVNVGLTRELSRLCRESGSRMIFLSTDTVFDGGKGKYRETDAPGPLNYYAETKVAAEKIVAETLDDSAIARLSLVIGLPILGAGNSFLAKMVTALHKGRQVGVPDQEIRSPIDGITLGRALLELAGNQLHGHIHLAGNDVLNRYDMARRIAERMGYPEHLVVAKPPSSIPGRAPRPRDVSLDNSKARATLKTPMAGLDEAIELILAAKKGMSQ